jgi:glycosyltransferase involved in cell wall biosynthesis
MGQPIVCFGPKLWQSHYLEIPKLGENGKHFFISDSHFELSEYINELMNNDELASNMSKEARKLGVELFGRENLKERWKDVLYK